MSVNPRRLEAVLLVIVFALGALGLAATIILHLRDPHGVLGLHFVRLFELDQEANVVDWFSSALLLTGAGLSALIAQREHRAGKPFARRWIALAAAFLYISLDEYVEIHEYLNYFLRDLENVSGLLYFGWVAPASAVVVILAILYRPLVMALPPVIRRHAVAGAILYVGGALGTEFGLGAWSSAHDTDNLGYGLIQTLQETLEMAGLTVFTGALLRLLANGHERLVFSFKGE